MRLIEKQLGSQCQNYKGSRFLIVPEQVQALPIPFSKQTQCIMRAILQLFLSLRVAHSLD